MQNRGQNRRAAQMKAERRYARRSVRSALFFACVVFVGICVYQLSLPSIRIRRIEGSIRAREFDQAMTAITALDDREEAERLENLCRLTMAQEKMENGEYEDAREAFLALGDYGEARQLAQECAFQMGEGLFEQGDYAAAMKQYLLVPDYPGSQEKMTEIKYIQAGQIEESDATTAYAQFAALGTYKDSAQRAEQLAMRITGESDPAAAIAMMHSQSQESLESRWAMISEREKLRRGALCVGAEHTVGLRRNGTVVAAGRNDEGQCDVDSWQNVTEVAAGAYHTAGLRSDGTVAATGLNDQKQCEVGGWQNVKAIACGDYATYALFADGTVAGTGYGDMSALSAWRNVNRISAGAYMAAGVYGDGEVYVTHPSGQSDSFSGLWDLALCTGGAVGLTEDGDTVANFAGFPEWTDIALLSAGSHGILGIDSHGRVLAHFFRFSDAFEVGSIENAVCVAAGGAHSAVLTQDGTVIAFGDNDRGQCDVSEWDLNQ